jgi:hypothetical protein
MNIACRVGLSGGFALGNTRTSGCAWTGPVPGRAVVRPSSQVKMYVEEVGESRVMNPGERALPGTGRAPVGTVSIRENGGPT